MDQSISRILSFDPGFTTGIAFLRDGQLEFGLVAGQKCFDQESFLLSLVKITHPTMIVVEKPPQSARFNVESHQVLFDTIVKWFSVAGFQVVTLTPGQWKGLVKRTEIDATHIRDAADMAKFAFRTSGEN